MATKEAKDKRREEKKAAGWTPKAQKSKTPKASKSAKPKGRASRIVRKGVR